MHSPHTHSPHVHNPHIHIPHIHIPHIHSPLSAPARPSLWFRFLALALAGSLVGGLSACGGGDPAEPEVPPTSEIEATAAPVEAAATEVIAATELPPTEEATEEPASPTPEGVSIEPTKAPPAATAVPATAGPTSPPVPTAAPANAWNVEFYPDNWTYQLREDQLCAGLNWSSNGVTELVFGREGFGSHKAEASGREGDICFPESDAEFYLEYRRPDGQVERKTVHLERDK